MSVALVARSRGVLRYSPWDGVLIALSGLYATLLLIFFLRPQGIFAERVQRRA